MGENAKCYKASIPKNKRQKMKLLTIKEVQGMQLDLMKILHVYLASKGIQYYMIAGSVLGAARHGGFIPWDDDIDIGMFRADYERFIAECGDFDSAYEIVNYHNGKNCDNCLTRIYFPNTHIDNKSIEKTKLDKRLYFDIFPLDNVPDDEKDRDKLEKKILRKKVQIARADARNYNNPWYILLVKKVQASFLTLRRERLLAKCDKLMQSYRDCDTNYICSICSQYSFKKQAMPRAFYGEPKLHCFEDTEFYVPERIDDYLKHLYGENYMEIPPEDKRRKGYSIYRIDED